MKKILFLLLISTLFATGYGHPVHVAIINISIEGSSITVKMSTFVDDWETAYFHYYGDTIHLNSQKNINGEWFREYLKKSLTLSSDKETDHLELKRDTIYFNDQSMTIEMHSELKEKPKTLYIYNSLLTDIFADQTNLIIISVNGKQKGIKFDYKKKYEELKLR